MTSSHVRAADWTNQVAPPRRTNRVDIKRTLEVAEMAGYELALNQAEQRWYWQSLGSTRLDWRGTGYPTRADACRAFTQGQAAL